MGCVANSVKVRGSIHSGPHTETESGKIVGATLGDADENGSDGQFAGGQGRIVRKGSGKKEEQI